MDRISLEVFRATLLPLARQFSYHQSQVVRAEHCAIPWAGGVHLPSFHELHYKIATLPRHWISVLLKKLTSAELAWLALRSSYRHGLLKLLRGVFLFLLLFLSCQDLFATRGRKMSEFSKCCEVVCTDMKPNFLLHISVLKNRRAGVSLTARAAVEGNARGLHSRGFSRSTVRAMRRSLKANHRHTLWIVPSETGHFQTYQERILPMSPNYRVPFSNGLRCKCFVIHWVSTFDGLLKPLTRSKACLGVCDPTCRCSECTCCRCSASTSWSETSDVWQQSYCSQKGPCVWVSPSRISMLGMLKRITEAFFFSMMLFPFQPLSQYCTKGSHSHHNMQLTLEARVHFLSSLVFISHYTNASYPINECSW